MTKVVEIELEAVPEPEKHSPLVEVGFNDNVVGKVYPAHLRHRENAEFDPHCVLCAQVGRRIMTLRNWEEIDDAAEATLLKMVKKGHKEACLFYLQRKQRDKSLWSRVRTLLGVESG